MTLCIHEPTETPVEYLICYIDQLGKVVDLTQIEADFGTLQDLADDGWRILNMNNWQMVAKQQAVTAVTATGQQAAQSMFMICLVTLWRKQNQMQPFKGLQARVHADDGAAAGLNLTR
jgi:hypothetical protein